MSEQNAGDVRREAFQAAAIAVDRFLERVGDPIPEVGQLGTAAWDRFRSELGRVVDLNLDIVRNAFDLYGSVLDPGLLKSDGRTLVIGPATPGTEAAAVLWLHNFDSDPLSGVDLVGSRLSAGEGKTIHKPGWSFTPSSVSVPAGSAVPVLVKVAIPTGTDGGSYEGTISALGHQTEPIELRVDVVAMSPIPHDSW